MMLLAPNSLFQTIFVVLNLSKSFYANVVLDKKLYFLKFKNHLSINEFYSVSEVTAIFLFSKKLFPFAMIVFNVNLKA